MILLPFPPPKGQGRNTRPRPASPPLPPVCSNFPHPPFFSGRAQSTEGTSFSLPDVRCCCVFFLNNDAPHIRRHSFYSADKWVCDAGNSWTQTQFFTRTKSSTALSPLSIPESRFNDNCVAWLPPLFSALYTNVGIYSSRTWIFSCICFSRQRFFCPPILKPF